MIWLARIGINIALDGCLSALRRGVRWQAIKRDTALNEGFHAFTSYRPKEMDMIGNAGCWPFSKGAM
jgi:hypothetical protein